MAGILISREEPGGPGAESPTDPGLSRHPRGKDEQRPGAWRPLAGSPGEGGGRPLPGTQMDTEGPGRGSAGTGGEPPGQLSFFTPLKGRGSLERNCPVMLPSMVVSVTVVAT